MKHIHLISNHQKGATLFEALIALVLTSIIALGGALSIGKIMQAHRQSNMQQIAVNQLRALLQSGSSLCGITPAPNIIINNQSLNVTVTCANQATTVNGANVTITKTVLSVTDSALGGEVRVGE